MDGVEYSNGKMEVCGRVRREKIKGFGLSAAFAANTVRRTVTSSSDFPVPSLPAAETNL